VKIALAAAHFHGFGVARQGLWITWVNKDKRTSERPKEEEEEEEVALHLQPFDTSPRHSP
jgi:hypothetical protein